MGRAAEPMSRHTYDRIGPAYRLIADHAEQAAREQGLEALALASGETVLEIGSGTGRAFVAISRSVGEAGRAYGMDLSWGMLHETRQQWAFKSLEGRGHLVLGDARSLPFPAGRFDAAFMSFTLELFEPADIVRVLAEVRRVLRPGGRLAVVCVARTGRAMTRLYEWLHRHFPHVADCRPIDVTSVLHDGGYRVETQREISLWGLPVIAAVACKTGPAARARRLSHGARPIRVSEVGAALGAGSDKEAI